TEVISYASRNIYDTRPESEIGNLVTDGFLHHFDWTYNFGITNLGFRDYFRQGNITIGDIVSVIPFENNLLEVTMTGDEILQVLEESHGSYAYSGIRYRFYYDDNDLVIHSVGIYENGGFYALSSSRSYKGLMADFCWWTWHLGLYSAIDTGVHYRTGVVEYLRTLEDITLYSMDGRINETDTVWTYDSHPTTTTTSATITTTTSTIPPPDLSLFMWGAGVSVAVAAVVLIVLRKRH
ncbi:MAG: 5'-nucleotidase, partial [Promethearchaeota archaeon]